MTDRTDMQAEVAEAMELLGKGYNSDPIPPNEFVSTVSGFTLAPDALINEYGYVTALVWGMTWRFCQMSDGVCRAGLEKIAERLGMSERTIIRHLDTLCEDGYLFDTTPNLKNKPHIYADTGKIKVRLSVSAGVTESQRAMTESQRRVTESQREGDRESVEESIKKQRKKELIISSLPELDLFVGYFGKFNSEKEIRRWQVVWEAVGKDEAERLVSWAFKKEIHLTNRGGLIDSIETAAKNWKGNGNGRHVAPVQKSRPMPDFDADGRVIVP